MRARWVRGAGGGGRGYVEGRGKGVRGEGRAITCHNTSWGHGRVVKSGGIEGGL